MTPQKLQPGPLRDALAALSEHTRGGEQLTIHGLSKRTGLPYHTARRRLNGLAAQGFATKAEGLGGEYVYTITDAGRAMLT
jgi:DNA-binding IclR family transcriptional regulator